MTILEQLEGRWKSGNAIEVERIHVTRAEFDVLRAEADSIRHLGQMIKDRVAQMPGDEDCSGLIDREAAIKEVAAVCNAHGHKCDDDSLWFQGSEWQGIMQDSEELRAEVERLQQWKESARTDLNSIDRERQAERAERDQLRAELAELSQFANKLSELQAQLAEKSAENIQLRSELDTERKISKLLFDHIGLSESDAFTESGLPNVGKLRGVLAELKGVV